MIRMNEDTNTYTLASSYRATLLHFRDTEAFVTAIGNTSRQAHLSAIPVRKGDQKVGVIFLRISPNFSSQFFFRKHDPNGWVLRTRCPWPVLPLALL